MGFSLKFSFLCDLILCDFFFFFFFFFVFFPYKFSFFCYFSVYNNVVFEENVKE